MIQIVEVWLIRLLAAYSVKKPRRCKSRAAVCASSSEPAKLRLAVTYPRMSGAEPVQSGDREGSWPKSETAGQC